VTERTIGVFGGSGLYRFLDEVEHLEVETPYGPPSAAIAIGGLHGRRVAFLPRHGSEHHLPPHRINYRANLWAFRSLGVDRILAPCASGSLRADIAPGHLVVCDQLIDRTSGRAGTFFDGPVVNHVSFADPYCEELRAALVAAAHSTNAPVHDRGTVVVVEGPRFSTRAESRWFRAAGGDIVNMTQHPEAALARELGICYAAIAIVTDYDAGLDDLPDAGPVRQDEVFARFEANLPLLRQVLDAAVAVTPVDRSCACESAANGLAP
jgi:5'-methylthioadenosine phosphorylase